MPKPKRVALLVGQQFEDMEVLYPYYRLLEAGFAVDVIGEDEPGTKYLGKYGYPILSTLRVDKAKAESYSGLIAPGGWAPDRLRRNPKILKLVKDIDRKGGVIASICHGPWILISAEVVKGKNMTSTLALKDDLTNAGARWRDAEVLVDGRMVTSRKPDDLPAFMREMLALLEKS